MYSIGCKTFATATTAQIKLRKKGTSTVLDSSTTWDFWTLGWLDYSNTALAAGEYTVEVIPKWQENDVKDYTLSIYAPNKIKILDSNNRQNEEGKHDYTYSGPSTNNNA